MKTTINKTKASAIVLLLLGAFAQSCLAPAQPGNSGYGNDPYDQYDDGYVNDDYRDDVTYQNFYDELSPYGRWTNYPGYGQVWQPNAGLGFQPYATNGHWALTNFGWTWVSNYNWGWAPFHYGRWFFDNRFGWGWQPGYEWAPAWVTWGQYAGNYGWAPLGPGMSINISFGRIPRNSWCFVPGRYINQRNWSNYRVNNTTIVNNVTIINNYGNGGRNGNRGGGFHRGPQVQDVQRYTRDRIRPLQVETVNRPDRQRVEGDRIGIYRPGARTSNGPSRNESVDNNRPVTRPGNRYERPGSPSRQNDDFNGSNRVGQANEGISQPDNAPIARPGVERPGSPSRQNDSWNRPNRSDDPAVNRPGTTWERPQRGSRSGEFGNEADRPSRWNRPGVERPAEAPNQSADRPMTRPGVERPGGSYGEGNRQPEMSRPERTERPNFGGGGRSSERQARPDYPTQRSQPQIQSTPAPAQPRSEGTNQSSDGSERPGRSRGRGPN